MREWLLVVLPVLIVVYFVIYPNQLGTLVAIAMRFIT
jgi:hypothetical protein